MNTAQIENLVVKLTGEYSSYEKMIDKAVEGATAAEKAQQKLNAQLQFAEKITDAVQTVTERYTRTESELNRLLKANYITQETYNRALGQARSTLPEVVADQERMNHSLREAARVTDMVETQTEKYQKQLQQLNQLHNQGYISAETYRRGLTHLNQQFDTSEQRMRAMLGTMRNVGQGMQRIGRDMSIYITAPLTAVGLFSVREFAKFDDAMTKSLAITKGVTPQIRAEMEAVAKDLAFEGIIGPDKLAESFYFLTSAGLSAEQSMAALPVVEKLAVAGAFELEKATSMLADSQAALGMNSTDAAKNMENMKRISDVLVDAANASNASVEQFATSLVTKSATSMRINNISLEEGVAVLAAYADAGVKAELAGEQFSIMIRDLQASVNKSPEQWEAMNLAVYDSEGAFRGPTAILRDLEDRLEGATDAQRRLTFEQLGFQDRSLAAIMTLVGLSDKIDDYRTRLEGAGGETERVANEQMKSFANQMKNVWNQIKLVALEIGQILVPYIQSMTEKLKAAIVWWRELSEPTKRFLIALGALLAIAGPVLVFVGTLTIAVAALAIAVNSALWPVLLVVGALAALVAAGVAVYMWGGKVLAVFQGWLDATFPLVGNILRMASAIAYCAGETEVLQETMDGMKVMALEAVDSINPLNVTTTETSESMKKVDEAIAAAEKTLAGLPTATDAAAESVQNFDAAMLESNEEADDLQKKVDTLTQKLQVQAETFGEATGVAEIYALKLKGATDEQLKAAEGFADTIHTKELEEYNRKLQDEINLFGMTSRAKDIATMKSKGFADGELAEAIALGQKLDEMEKEKELRNEAKQIIERNMTAEEKYAAKKAELQTLVDKELITTQVMNKELDSLKKKTDKPVDVKFKTSGVESVLAGSAAGIAALEDFRARQSAAWMPTSSEGPPEPKAMSKEQEQRFAFAQWNNSRAYREKHPYKFSHPDSPANLREAANAKLAEDKATSEEMKQIAQNTKALNRSDAFIVAAPANFN